MAKPTLRLEPHILKWARASMGISREQAAKRFKIDDEELSDWEEHGLDVSPSFLEAIARFYRRPTAALFLHEPPREPAAPADFRLFGKHQSRKLSPKANLALRRARWLQAAYAEFRDVAQAPRLLAPRASTSDDLATLASRVRQAIGVSVSEQKSWRRSGRAFAFWREKFEEGGIPVFVFSAGSDFRGCSLPGATPVILIGSGDYTPTGRTFTLFHEWCHILLGEPGICHPDEATRGRENATVEAFCNAFAGEFLIPTDELLEESSIKDYRAGRATLENTAVSLATLYSVSRAMALIRMRSEGMAQGPEFSRLLAIFTTPALKRKVKIRGRTRAKRAVAELGAHFVRQALSAAERGAISYRDLTDYLSVGVSDLERVQEHLVVL